jgi:hypothetical protein
MMFARPVAEDSAPALLFWWGGFAAKVSNPTITCGLTSSGDPFDKLRTKLRVIVPHWEEFPN